MTQPHDEPAAHVQHTQQYLAHHYRDAAPMPYAHGDELHRGSTVVRNDTGAAIPIVTADG